jgi:hypothetical protein
MGFVGPLANASTAGLKPTMRATVRRAADGPASCLQRLGNVERSFLE